MDHNDLFISSFYGLPQEVIQEISQKPLEAQCIFTQQPDFEDEEQFVPASNIVLLQIRGNYVVQCQPRSKRIAGGMFLCLDNKFEVKRRSDDLEADVGEPYAICFQIPSKFDESDHIELKFGVKRAKWRELEKFVQCLEKKNIFQTNIYNDYNNSDRIFYSSTACLYEAVNKKSGKLCVIKQIKKQLFQQSGRNIKMAIEREFSIPYSFNHPNICKYFGVFDYNQSIYIVMERLQGNLLHFLHSPFIKIEIEIKLIFKKICQAVKILHDHYVMHRDLKPQNIAMRRVNQFIYDPVLIDFGLAQFEDKLPFVFTQCGTPGYIAPEIVRTRTPNIVYDRKCDIFSLGCIFHLMWLGKAPFDSQNFPQVKDVKQVIKRNVQCFVDRNNNKYQRLAPEIKQLLFWMLEIDPKKRPTIDQVLSHKFFDVLKTVQQTDILRDKQKLFQLAMSKKIVSQSQGCREGSKQITKEKTEKQKQKEKQMELQVNKEQGYNQNEVKQKKQENNKVLIHQCAEEIPKANDGTPELSIEGHSLRQ